MLVTRQFLSVPVNYCYSTTNRSVCQIFVNLIGLKYRQFFNTLFGNYDCISPVAGARSAKRRADLYSSSLVSSRMPEAACTPEGCVRATMAKHYTLFTFFLDSAHQKINQSMHAAITYQKINVGTPIGLNMS